MVSDIFGDTRTRILQSFPERQIYLRSGGEVTYFNLSTRLQVSAVSVVAIMALWCLVSILIALFDLSPIGSADKEVRQVEAHYQRLLANSQAKEKSAKLMLSEQRENFEQIAATIEAKHNTLSQIVGSVSLPTNFTDSGQQFAEADILVAPVTRDAVDRVALRASIDRQQPATGLAIDASLASLDLSQNDILMTAEAELLDRIDFNRAIIRATELDIDTVLEQSAQGQGGPYIPIDGFDLPTVDGEFHDRIAAIQARLYESETLASVVRTLPLGQPVDADTMLTSSFGVRSDPFTKRPTFHQGLDFISGPLAPIVATAPGTITFAGRKGAYGNVVDIDHGHGFMTRYAHLKKIYVKRGQTVDEGERVGGMGSTGRSTATHLHYEVHFQGRAYDPKKFLKAGLHVQ